MYYILCIKHIALLNLLTILLCVGVSYLIKNTKSTCRVTMICKYPVCIYKTTVLVFIK